MKPIERKMLVVAVGLVLGLGSGCRQDATPQAKQARLIAAESMQLRKQLADCDEQMKQLNARHAEEIEQRQTQLTACRTRIEALEKDLRTGIAQRVDSVMAAVIDENAKLRKEIETLKAQRASQP